MSEEKKPKIDLKARLGKTSGASIPPAQGSSEGAGDSIPAPAAPSASVPAPAPAAQPVYQRFEVDDSDVTDARKAGFKQGVTVAIVVGLAALGIGYAAGGASEKSAGRAKAVADMTDLAKKADDAKAKLALLQEKLEAGVKELGSKKFPDSLAGDLGAINVDFDGAVLGGRRFSGVSLETTKELIEFATDVASVNERKGMISTLLGKLKDPIEKKFKGGDKVAISYAVVVEGSGKNSPIFATLAGLQKSLETESALPAKFTVMSNGKASDVPAYAKGDASGKAIALSPGSFERICPDDTKGAQAQLIAQLRGLTTKLKGEDQTSSPDAKSGLVERAAKLSIALKKAGEGS